MSETVTIRTIAATPGALKQSISEFAAGQLSKREIREVLSRALIINPSSSGDIQAFIDHEVSRRRMSAKDHRELLDFLGQSLSENVPTEASDDLPNQPGLYRVDDEGTMILADDLADALPAESASGKPPSPPVKPRSQLRPGSLLRERFRLDEEIARGSMGIVYKATDMFKLEAGANSPTIAVKVINPEFANDKAALKSFQNEVANTQHLSHPHIVHLFELDRDDGHYFITMEWLDGESLDALLDRSKGSALPPVQAYAIIEQLCDALAYAHEQNVVHADVKPGNVFLTKPGELKLIDFGIACVDQPADADASAGHGSVGLTPAYASCECLERQPPTPQDDLFSLACLIYRLLSGRRVFGPATALQAEVSGTQPVRIGGMSDERWAALRQALSFRRADRQSTVREFAAAFGKRRVARENHDALVTSEEEVPFTETMTLQSLPEDVNPELHNTGKLKALTNLGQPVLREEDTHFEDLLNDTAMLNESDDGSTGDAQPVAGGAVIESDMESVSPLEMAAAGSSEAAIAALAAGDLSSLPEPINFFDEDSDDSVFVPLESATEPAGPAGAPVATGTEPTEPFAGPLETGTGTVPTEASALATVELSIDDLQEPEGQPPAAVAPAQSAATDATAAPSTRQARDVADPLPKREDATPAVFASRQAATPQVTGGAALYQMLLARLSTVPLRVRASIAAMAALVAIAVVWSGDGGQPEVASPAASSGVSGSTAQSPIGGRTEASPQDFTRPAIIDSNPANNLSSASQPVADMALDGMSESATSTLVIPENTADTGIAAPRSIVPVPLGLPAPRPAARPAAPLPQAAPAAAQAEVARAEQPVIANPARPQRAKPAPVKPDNTARLRELDKALDAAIAAGRLVQPAEQSAVAAFVSMRALEADASLTELAGDKLRAALEQRAEQAIAAADAESASYWADQAAANGVSAATISALWRSIAELKAANAAQAAAAVEAAAAAEAAAAQQAAAEAAAEDALISLSEVEFVRYVAPEYPRNGSGNKNGWVEVSFTVTPQGDTTDIAVIDSNLSERFNAPSIAAVEKWRFEPYLRDGEATAVKVGVRLRLVD